MLNKRTNDRTWIISLPQHKHIHGHRQTDPHTHTQYFVFRLSSLPFVNEMKFLISSIHEFNYINFNENIVAHRSLSVRVEYVELQYSTSTEYSCCLRLCNGSTGQPDCLNTLDTAICYHIHSVCSSCLLRHCSEHARR